jgi:hypothetical protein
VQKKQAGIAMAGHDDIEVVKLPFARRQLLSNEGERMRKQSYQASLGEEV